MQTICSPARARGGTSIVNAAGTADAVDDATIALPVTPSKHKFWRFAAIGLPVLIWMLATGWAATAERRFDVLANDDRINFTADQKGFTGAAWTNKAERQFTCLIGDSAVARHCGINISLVDNLDDGLDASGYDAIELTLGYSGMADLLRVFMVQTITSGPQTPLLKYQSTSLALSEGVYKYRIPLSRVTVPQWWKTQHPGEVDHFKSEFTDLFLMGLDIQTPVQSGLHHFGLYGFVFVEPFLSGAYRNYWFLGSFIYIVIFIMLARYLSLRLQLKQRHMETTELHRELSMLDQESERLKELSSFDPLTKLLNRRAALSIVDEAREQRALAGTGLILLDIDHFKRFNDTHGHAVGDLVLRETAARIKAELRESDSAIRWGGEELLVLCQDSSPAETLELAERMRSTLATNTRSEGELQVTASFGVAVCGAEETFEAALERADSALYRAKSEGRNRCELADAIPPISAT